MKIVRKKVNEYFPLIGMRTFFLKIWRYFPVSVTTEYFLKVLIDFTDKLVIVFTDREDAIME